MSAERLSTCCGLSPAFLVFLSLGLCEGECKGEAHFVFAVAGWRGGRWHTYTHRLTALRRITDNWRLMLSCSPADRCQSACSKSRGYALLFFPYTAINPVFSPVCEECRRIPMTRLRRVLVLNLSLLVLFKKKKKVCLRCGAALLHLHSKSENI